MKDELDELAPKEDDDDDEVVDGDDVADVEEDGDDGDGIDDVLAVALGTHELTLGSNTLPL